MVSSPTSEVFMDDKNDCKIVTDIFQKYVEKNPEIKFFWEFIKMNFKNLTKEH